MAAPFPGFVPGWTVPLAVVSASLGLWFLRRWFQPKVYLSAVQSLLTPAELRFYRVLCRTVPDDHLILAKVRIADLINVSSKHAPSRQRVFRSVASKHVDFVIVRRTDLKPLAALELDDSSHRQGHRRKRDELVDRVFTTADLPLIRVKAAARYSTGELAAALEPVFC
ncbi:MAG: DUF2726 domain-containing protein [Verrucomicrobia bacterium]|nr:DUF2726 domain-containing protein [Verrucomicrobiota bacterium]